MNCRNCPTCGQPIRKSDPIEDARDGLAAYCYEFGIIIDWDDSVREVDAARLLNREPRTLANWRFIDKPIPFKKSRGRVRYKLRDLAKFLYEEENS